MEGNNCVQEIKDNWFDRSDRMKCQSCMWFVTKNIPKGIGRCRKNTPTISGFPVVYNSDWCGNHKLDENYE